MSKRNTDSELLSQWWTGILRTPHTIVLQLIWLAATTVLILMLGGDVRATGQYSDLRYVLQAGYVAALLWYLIRTGPVLGQLPELSSQIMPRRKYGAWIPVTIIALFFVLTVFSEDGFDLVILLMIIATVWILIAWRKMIHIRMALQGLVVALIAYFAGLPLANNGFVQEKVIYILAGFSFPMYLAGGLLAQKTGLGGIQLIASRYGESLKSVFRGGVLFFPLGLFNAAGGSPGSNISWVTEWWMPLSIPWYSGIAEEIWFRLLLIGLVFFLLRPAFRARPALAVLAAVIFSAVSFGLGHGHTLERFLTTGLLYGIPMAVVFTMRDWEHAVGAHYMINMIPWMLLFLETL